MIPTHFIGSLFAIASSLSWGGGDFFGGLAMQKGKKFQALVIAMISGIILLAFVVFIAKEEFPPIDVIIFPILAGSFGSLGLGALYFALSENHSAIVAPTSAVISVGIPVIFNVIIGGLPPVTALTGFAIALISIWLVSQSDNGGVPLSKKGLALTLGSGVGLGLFYIFMSQTPKGYVFSPLICSRGAALTVTLIIFFISRDGFKGALSNPIAILSGILDAGGNALYMLARQYTREDIAVVLSSVYPAVNVVLAWIIVKEAVSRKQWFGVVLCVVAVGLISL